MYWDEELHEAISLHEKSINISPDYYLVQRHRHSSMTFFLDYKESETTVCGIYRHGFAVEEAEMMLRKQTILKKTFSRLELPYTIRAELGNGDGSIVIELAKKTFAEEEDAAIEDYCARFVTAMALLQTAELYGGS